MLGCCLYIEMPSATAGSFISIGSQPGITHKTQTKMPTQETKRTKRNKKRGEWIVTWVSVLRRLGSYGTPYRGVRPPRQLTRRRRRRVPEAQRWQGPEGPRGSREGPICIYVEMLSKCRKSHFSAVCVELLSSVLDLDAWLS
jgi:hypothetical protein